MPVKTGKMRLLSTFWSRCTVTSLQQIVYMTAVLTLEHKSILRKFGVEMHIRAWCLLQILPLQGNLRWQWWGKGKWECKTISWSGKQWLLSVSWNWHRAQNLISVQNDWPILGWLFTILISSFDKWEKNVVMRYAVQLGSTDEK